MKNVHAARISQYAFLAIFLVLFILTDYRGKDEISVAVNGFFRANPLVLVTYMLAEKGFTLLLLPGAVMFAFSALLGRFFCGWICPLGTIIDLIPDRLRTKTPLRWLKGRVKYILLFTLLFAALFNVNVAGVLDPIAILMRALSLLLYPLFGHVIRSSWSGLYGLIGEQRDAIQFLYDVLRAYILPFRETLYPLAFLSGLMLLAILYLERYERRNWCRNLCPLGTLLGLVGRLSLIKRVPGRICADCGDCRKLCPTAFDEDILQSDNCIRCGNCSLGCKLGRAKFTIKGWWSGLRRTGTAPDPARRALLGGLVSGFMVSRVFSFSPPAERERLLRPPGVVKEGDFLNRCVRCGECMKVCLQSALYPAALQAGMTGIFTPIMVPRLGYCEYNCNLCGQVCPTGAIPNLPLNEKKRAVIGTAVFDKDHCLPYAKKINCIVCEEHCPIPGKAIKFETVEDRDFTGKKVVLKRPYVVDELCNGCGICENKCPLEEKSAIEVFAKSRRGLRGTS